VNRKKTILFIGEAVSLAHVSRPLVLAKALDPDEYDIHFSCDHRYESLLLDSPHIHYWPIRSILGKTFIKSADRADFHYQKNDIESYIHQELGLFNNVAPELIISDFRPTVTLSAEISHIPYATISNVHWSPYRLLDFNPVPPQKKDSQIRRYINFILPRKKHSLSASINEFRRSYGLPLIKNYCDLSTRGDYTLYAEPPGLLRTSPLPPNHYFLGPILWSPNVTKPTWWHTWNPDLPLIYITLGSTGITKHLPEVIQSLRGFPATFIVATAGRFQIKNLPQNVFSADYLPGLEICQLASVVVCNGGSATAYQALSQGTPVVGIWSNLDQYLTMMMIENAGAGICIPSTNINYNILKDNISTILTTPNFRTKSTEIRDLFASYNVQERFQQLVKKLFS
jgi:UDP:flavonoid glycosyltransferase YjiC (YdhE family)